MFNIFTSHSVRVDDVHEVREFHLPRIVEKVKTTFKDGLLSSVVTHEKEDPHDDHLSFRAYSLQSIIQAEAKELLQPLGAVKMSAFDAQDTSIGVSASLADMQEYVNKAAAAQAAPSVEPSK